MPVEQRGAHEDGGRARGGRRAPCLVASSFVFDVHSKSSGSRFSENHVPEGFIPFGLRLIFLSFETLK